MAITLNLGKKKWVKIGFTPEQYDKLLDQGYQPAWLDTTVLTLVDTYNNEPVGKAYLSKNTITKVDGAFQAAFHSATSEDIPQAVFQTIKPQTIPEIKITFPGGGSLPVSQPFASTVLTTTKLKDAAEELSKPVQVSAQKPGGVSLRLKDATKVGEKVQGTSQNSTYTVYMISPDTKIAFKRSGTGLSIRAEAFGPDTAARLSSWGMEVKGDYASVHLSCNSQDVAVRTLGSLCLFVVTGMPTDILSKALV